MDEESLVLVNKTLTHLPRRRPVDIEFHDISYSVPDGKKSSKLILKGINGKFVSGQLTAILGPSGAGKSTLLNILAGYKCEGMTGNILINGQKRKVEKFWEISRYIMQDDYVQPFLTVQESMKIAADLKLGSSETRESKEIMIEEILDLLRLKKCRDTKARGLSGGERKRLSIALELLNNPPVIFLDEPTTGLDDVACSQCIGLMKQLAKGGRTVVCVLHTPSARLVSVFDNVYMMSQGQCVFQGSASSLVPFLSSIGLVCPKSYNPVDFMMEVCSKEYGDFQSSMVSIVENGQNKVFFKNPEEVTDQSIDELNEITSLEKNQTYVDMADSKSTFFDQLKVLILRMWMQIYRDKGSLLVKLITYSFLGLLLGNMYIKMGNDGSKTLFNFGFFYMCIIIFMIIPMMPVLLYFPHEIKVLKREHFNRWYGIGAYYAAICLLSIPVQLLLTAIYVGITYTMTGQPMEIERFVLFFLILTLTSLVAESVGIFFGSLFSIVNALFLGTCSAVPLMLLATYGFGSGAETIPGWIQFSMRFSYLRYSMEALMSTMLKNRDIIPCPEEEDWCMYTDVSYFLKSMGMLDCVLWVDIVMLLGFLVFFRLLSFYCLKQRLTPNKLSQAITVLAKIVKTHLGPQ